MTRVMVVDDSALARRALRLLFAPLGVEVVEASSVAEARGLLAERPQAAVLDLELGDGSGLEIADDLVRLLPSCRLAFVSASTDEALLARARERGPVFPKPHGLPGAVEHVLSPLVSPSPVARAPSALFSRQPRPAIC